MKHLQRADIDCGLGMELEVLDYGSRDITAQLTVQGDEHGAGQVRMHELLDQILVVSRERFHVEASGRKPMATHSSRRKRIWKLLKSDSRASRVNI